VKPLTESPWKQRFFFFIAGASFALICGFIHTIWMDIIPYTSYNQQPDILKRLREFVGWLPGIAIVVVFIFRLAKGRWVRVGAYFLGTVAPLVLLITWFCIGPSVSNLMHRQKFDAELWRNPDKIEQDIMWPPRLCMVDHLMSSGQLDGLTSDQVVQLLGHSHDKSFPFGAKSCDIHYYLGPDRGFWGMDSEWLFITFGKDGEVNRYWLYVD
jgi:hypothetical protein